MGNVALTVNRTRHQLELEPREQLVYVLRDRLRLTGTNDEAIAYAVRHTARVITGAALIMTSVFVAFALADVASMRQLGIGLSVAVLLDATLVRLVLLPPVTCSCLDICCEPIVTRIGTRVECGELPRRFLVSPPVSQR